MIVHRLKSLHPVTSISPKWDIPIFQTQWNDVEKIDKIRNFLIEIEPRILDIKTHHDADTGLGKDSVTSRFSLYNLFDFTNECPELDELLTFLRESYLNFCYLEQLEIQDLEMTLWYNIVRQGHGIDEHKHGAGNNVYLSGNMHLDNYPHTTTYYRAPIDENHIFPAENTKGGLTLFPSYVPHGVNKNEKEELRLSIAFDLRLAGAESWKNNPNLQTFMNEEILASFNG
jgi:hypothetical protein